MDMNAELTRLFSASHEMVFIAAGIFTRVGAALFLVPGLGERGISIRIRLAGALAITALLAPLIAPLVPKSPSNLVGLGLVLGAEAVAGLIIGLAFRILIYALQIAGMIAAQHLSLAQMFGSGVAPEPEPTIATLLGMGGVVLALIAGLHVHLVAALAGLYDVMPFGVFIPGATVAEWTTARMADGFAIGVSLAAPFIVIGFVYNLALGALNRAMPQLLVALVGVPALVWLGMLVLFLCLPMLFTNWGAYLNNVLIDPLARLR